MDHPAPKSHMPQLSPFVLTAPWRSVLFSRQAGQYVKAENSRWGRYRMDMFEAEDADNFLIQAARELTARRGSAFVDPLIERRIRDAFGRWSKRIGKRRKAAFEAYMLTDDPDAIKAGYAYADMEYVNLRNKRSKAKLDEIVAKAVERARKSA